jgi:hypothetical protein
MQLRPYRKETDPELIKAASAAYDQSLPQQNGGRSAFARNRRAGQSSLTGIATEVPRGDHASAA